MTNPYNGNASGLNEDSAVTIIEPADGDFPNAALFNPPYSKLADLVEYLRANTVKRTLGALGASSPSGQTGPVPYKVASTEAFDFYAATQTHNDPHPIAKYIPIAGDDGQRDTRTYYDINGDIIITRGCYSIDAVAASWERSGTRTGAAYKFSFGLSGIKVQVKNAGGAGDTWLDSAWDKTLTLDTSSGVQGDVLGVLSGSAIGFGRPREAMTAGWTALGSVVLGTGVETPQGFKDASGVIHLMGSATLSGAVSNGQQLVTLPAALRPSTARVASVAGAVNATALTPNSQAVQFTISSTGEVDYNGPVIASGGTTFYFDGISFIG